MSAAAIKKQIEFYFSDSNFRKDVFLKTHADSDPEGFVPISVLLTFNKLKALTTDIDAIVNALEDSKVVIVSEDKLKLRRSQPLPEDDDSKARTLYVKGFPVNDSNVTVESVAEQFSSFGKVVMVRLRKLNDKSFKGSVFIEFEDQKSVEDACKAAYDESKTIVKLCYKDTPFLCVLPLAEWLDRKKAKHNKPAKSSQSVEPAVGSKRKAQTELESKEQEAPKYTSGLVLKVNDLPTDATFVGIKEAFKTLGKIEYVDYKTGETNAIVRVADNETALKVLEVVKEGFKLTEGDEKPLSAVLLEGSDEENYWKEFNAIKKTLGNSSRGRGRKSFGKRGRR